MPQASFIVIAFNEAATLERTLRSITAQEELDDYEILVIDDASTDDTVAVAERYAESDPSLRVIRQATNRGRGAARKLGVEAARGEFIATVDSDIVLPPAWYRTCRAELADDDAVGGIAVPDGDVAYLYRRFGLEPRPVPHIVGLTGNNALYRSSVFSAVQFDEDLRNGEDVALGHAMDAAGLRARVIDGLYVRHEESKTFAQSLAWLFESGIGASRQLRRFRQPRPPDLVFAAFLASAGMGAILARGRRPLLGAVLPAAYLGAASGAHVGTRFRLQRGRSGRFAGAVAADSALLLAYFAGRLTGHARLSEAAS
jgi:glycosyltransferase involved in cell wall biosynthesis